MTAHIRLARPGDEPDIVAMIHQLAEFERAPEECTVTESQITAALFSDDMPVSVYDNLISTVRANLPALHRYYALRRRLQKLDELNAPLRLPLFS